MSAKNIYFLMSSILVFSFSTKALFAQKTNLLLSPARYVCPQTFKSSQVSSLGINVGLIDGEEPTHPVPPGTIHFDHPFQVPFEDPTDDFLVHDGKPLFDAPLDCSVYDVNPPHDAHGEGLLQQYTQIGNRCFLTRELWFGEPLLDFTDADSVFGINSDKRYNYVGVWSNIKTISRRRGITTVTDSPIPHYVYVRTYLSKNYLHKTLTPCMSAGPDGPVRIDRTPDTAEELYYRDAIACTLDIISPPATPDDRVYDLSNERLCKKWWNAFDDDQDYSYTYATSMRLRIRKVETRLKYLPEDASICEGSRQSSLQIWRDEIFEAPNVSCEN